jgi:hypothetical protein
MFTSDVNAAVVRRAGCTGCAVSLTLLPVRLLWNPRGRIRVFQGLPVRRG